MNIRTLAAALLFASSVPAFAANANVTVVHGIPGGDLGLPPELPVDVCVIDPGTDSESAALTEVPFGASAGLSLPAGFYSLNIRIADTGNPCAGAVAIPVSFTVSVAENSVILAHLTEQGTPTFSKYVNDLRALGADRGRVVVRHAAAAPPVNVFLKGRSVAILRNLRNPDQSVSTLVRAGAYKATVFPATGGRAVLGPAPITVNAGKALFIHAVGSLSTGSFTVIPVEIAVP